MSELTKEIAGVTNRIRTQDPGPRGPSFLAGLADAASTAIDGVQNIRANRQEARARREAAEQERVMDELELANFADREAQFEALNTVRQAPIDIPPDVQRGVEELATIQDSVAQGRTTQARARTALESRYRQMMTDHPELASEIAIYMRDQGLDSRVYREIALAEEQADFERETRQQLQRENETYAVQNIPADQLGSTADQRAAQGAALMVRDNEFDRTRELATEARAAAGERREAARFAQSQAVDAAFRGSAAHLAANLDPYFNQLVAQITSGQLPPGPGRLQAINELNARIWGQRQFLRGELIGEIGAEGWAQIESQLDQYQETLQQVVTSDDATQMLSMMEANAGVAGLEAIGRLAVVRAMVGDAAFGAVMGPELFAEAIENGTLSAAASNLLNAPTNPANLANVAAMGQAFQRIRAGNGTPEDIQAVGPVLVRSVSRSTEALLNDQEGGAETFAMDYPALLVVTGEDVFQRGMTNPSEAEQASEVLFGADKIEALRRVDDSNLTRAARRSAERALNALMTSPEVDFLGSNRVVSWDAEEGRFFATPVDRDQALAQMAFIGQGRAAVAGPTDGPRTPASTEAVTIAATLNRLTDFLVETGDQQGSPREQRAEWARQSTGVEN